MLSRCTIAFLNQSVDPSLFVRLMVIDCACKGRWREWVKMAHQFAIRQGKGISIALVIHSFDPCLREVLGFHLIMQAGVGFSCAQPNLRDSYSFG